MTSIREASAKISAARISAVLLFSTFAVSAAAWEVQDVSQSLPARIDQVSSNGAWFNIVVATLPGSTAADEFALKLRGAEGQLLDNLFFSSAPQGGEALHILNADINTLVDRGWQHSVDLELNGTLLHSLDVRLELDCGLSQYPCMITARSGVNLTKAVAMPHSLAEAFADNNNLLALAASPALAGPAFTAAVDIMSLIPSDKDCVCFYTADVSDYGGAVHTVARARLAGETLELQHWGQLRTNTPQRLTVTYDTERRVEVGFACHKLSAVAETLVNTSAGMLTVPLPTLSPCASECEAPVEWRMTNLRENIVFRSEGAAEVDLAYQMRWKLADEAADLPAQTSLVQSFGNQWQGRGSMLNTRRITSFAPAPSVVKNASAPSLSSLEVASFLELRDWSQHQRPKGQVSVGADLEALGTSSCTAPAQIRVAGTFYPDGPRPTVLRIEVGPDEEDP